MKLNEIFNPNFITVYVVINRFSAFRDISRSCPAIFVIFSAYILLFLRDCGLKPVNCLQLFVLDREIYFFVLTTKKKVPKHIW